jgi:DNA-binding NarL/FixJ family response regulator
MEGMEKQIIARCLEECEGNVTRAAERLGLSPRTVESHIGAMFEKTGCRNRSQLLLWGQMNGRRTRGSMEIKTGKMSS